MSVSGMCQSPGQTRALVDDFEDCSARLTSIKVPRPYLYSNVQGALWSGDSYRES
jgi:hypothetical protein